MSKKIAQYLHTKVIGRKIICLETIDSTNSELRRRACAEEEGTVILSEQQTGGRGRLGREWLAPKNKGIWMSVLLKPDLSPAEIPQLTLTGAAAICLALEKADASLCGQVTVKWPNDILLNGRKLSGILTEMQIRANTVQSIVLGIGLNLYQREEDFPPELGKEATSLLRETGKYYDSKMLTAEILNFLESLYNNFLEQGNISESLVICRQRSAVIGQKVILVDQEQKQEAEVLDLGTHGELVVRLPNGKVTSVISGEISLRRT